MTYQSRIETEISTLDREVSRLKRDLLYYANEIEIPLLQARIEELESQMYILDMQLMRECEVI